MAIVQLEPGPAPERGRHPKAGRRRERRGLAAVELALCLPIVLVTALGMIETSNVVFVQTRMQSVAYEGVRVATRPTTSAAQAATAATVITECNTMLSQLGVNGATVTLNPSSLTSLVPQQTVTVTITAPLSQNSTVAYVLSSSMTLTASATLVCE
jgi:Flp pilus assembly protein TadG